MSAPATTATIAPAVGGSDAARKVARRVEELAADPILADRQEQLQQLAQALSDRDQAAGWEDVQLHTALGYPIPPEAGGRRIAAWVGGVRVALVFVPVAVTWAGVSWAGWLYQRELARDPELGTQSFFRLWLSGFDGAMPSFHVMAVIIAMAVFAIIALTIAIARDEAHAAGRRRRLQGRLNRVLTEASVQLARGRTSSPDRFLDDLTRTSEGLADLVGQVRSAAEAATSAMAGAAAATDAAREAATQAQHGAATLAGSADTLADAAGRTEAATTRLLTDALAQGDAATQSITNAVGGLANAASGIQQTIGELSAHLDEHRDRLGMRLDENERATQALLPELVDRIADAQAAALDRHLADLRDAISGLAQQERSLAASIASLKRRPASRAPVPQPRGVSGLLKRLFRGE